MKSVRREERGLTLVEVLVAIFVVSVGVLGTSAVLWYAIKGERNAERRTQAVYWAREMLNTIQAQNLPFVSGNPPAPPAPLNDGDYDSDGDDNGPRRAFNAPPFENSFPNLNFERRIEMKVLSTDNNSHLSQIAAIKVTLFWNEGAKQKQVTIWGYHTRP